MPYALSLQQYCEPAFYREAPPEWVRRLREVAPQMPDLDHLVFRYIEPTEVDGSDKGWQYNERGQWVLYSAKDIRLVDKDRAAQFEKHWSELPVERQAGLRACVSDYQHFMWHSKGLYVKPFLILQGQWGGTPAKYTEREIAFLKGSNYVADPFPIGSFPACPFDERVVAQIGLRDRLLQQSNSYDALAKLDTPSAMKADEDAAAILQRTKYLETFAEMYRPAVEFYQSFIRTKEADRIFPKAPEGTARAVAQWKEHFIQYGSVIGAKVANQRRVQMTVR